MLHDFEDHCTLRTTTPEDDGTAYDYAAQFLDFVPGVVAAGANVDQENGGFQFTWSWSTLTIDACERQPDTPRDSWKLRDIST